MREKSIEGTIKQLELILKAREIHKECVGESCINCNPDIEALTNSIEFLSDYKRVLKENEELKEYKKIAELTKTSCCIAQNCEALNNAIKEGLKNQRLQKENEELKEDNKHQWKERCRLTFELENSIPVQKVKDTIKELENEYEYLAEENQRVNKLEIQLLQGLLESED